MNAADRIVAEPCGCRSDVVTATITHFCEQHELKPLAAEVRWASETTVTLQRFAFERAVRNLPRFEAWALIRAAYNCSLIEAKAIYVAVVA